jgi:hypothetical protein
LKTKNLFKKHLLILTALSICPLLLVACSEPPAVLPAANETNQANSQIEIDLLGTKYEANVDGEGRLESGIWVTSAGGLIGLSIDQNTVINDPAGEPVPLIQASIDPNPPSPPEDTQIMGLVYELAPPEALLTPQVKLTIGYNSEEIPEGTAEDDIYIASYEDGQWQKLLYKQVDSASHRVTTQIDHFARYAVLAPYEENTIAPTTDSSDRVNADRVDVVYFHRAQRCNSCVYAEDQTVYTLETYFSEELTSGIITFQSVNVQDEANAALIEQYGAYTSQLFIRTIQGDTEYIEEVIEFWQFIGDDEGFSNLITTKITEALEGAG